MQTLFAQARPTVMKWSRAKHVSLKDFRGLKVVHWNVMAWQLVNQLSLKVGLVCITWTLKCMLRLQGMYEAHS